VKKEMKAREGYIVVERNREGRRKILYADSAACTAAGFAKETLAETNPEQLLEQLDALSVELDQEHELWILGAESQKASQEALEQQNKILEAALTEAEEANKAKSRFLSNMSHDIRTPMNAIMGMASIGLSHIDEKLRVQDCLNKIQTASSHLMSLVNDVLDMSRIDSGRMTLNEEEFSLADLLHDIMVIVRPQAEQKNQNLQVEIHQIHEEDLMGDPLRLRQILVNIIGNAVKYTQAEGNITVRFTQNTLKDSTQTPLESRTQETKGPGQGENKVWLDFQCEDNGIGMSKEFLKKICTPFERVQNALTSKIEGTGLGMSIVKNLVERMGGSMSVESEEGVGSSFRVMLPFAVAHGNRKNMELPVGETVLIAENRDDLAEQMEAYLQEGGLKSMCMKAGLKAVTWLTEAQYENHMPCALLLGQELADMSVLDLAAHVRQLAGREFPIILVSEEDWAQLEYRATRAGVNAFVPCPLFKSKLLQTLAELTNNGSDHDETYLNRKKDYSGYRVLLVEDVELNQEIAVELLSMTGVQVDVADNGARAVEMFEASPDGYYSVIFMDIQMPVMNGYEATKRIRQMTRQDAENVWIVAMTANAFVEDVRQEREAGMNEHISKPVDPVRLQEILFRQL